MASTESASTNEPTGVFSNLWNSSLESGTGNLHCVLSFDMLSLNIILLHVKSFLDNSLPSKSLAQSLLLVTA